MIEYVIYCRKSSEESSGQQAQSIPDQIQACIDYARNNDLLIATKPDNFSMFESEADIAKEDSDSEIVNRRLYKDTRNLFIIKEQKTAKVPWAREKRKNLIKQVKRWKIKGVLSYSPDRQSRNMMEWWELIDLVDQWLVDLKYTNFHFEPTASGKMMLGIWFVFSKQYADKLSEDITRGNKSKKEQGKSLSKYKYGYFTNSEWYYEPHPKYFDLMKRAFEMKIYEDKSDQEIADWLNANGFVREFKTWNKSVKAKRLTEVWRNEVYYGMYVSNDGYYDLRELNPYYKPMITEAEFNLLREKLSKWKKTKRWKEENKEYYPFPKGLLKAPDGSSFSCTLPNSHRFKAKFSKLKETKRNARYGEVIKPVNIHFRVMNNSSKFKNLKLSFDQIEPKIIEILNQMKIDEKAYNEYVNFAETQIDVINKKKRTESNRLQLQINKVSWDRKDYIKAHMRVEFTEEERSIYDEHLASFQNRIDLLEQTKKDLDISERNEILELSMFVEMLNKAGGYYKKATYVQKRKVSSILFSNIVVDNKKRLTVAVNPMFEWLFSHVMKMPGVEPGSRSH